MLFLFFLIMNLDFLIPAVNIFAQVFSPTVELAIPTGIRTEEEKLIIATHPVTAEAKISDCSM